MNWHEESERNLQIQNQQKIVWNQIRWRYNINTYLASTLSKKDQERKVTHLPHQDLVNNRSYERSKIELIISEMLDSCEIHEIMNSGCMKIYFYCIHDSRITSQSNRWYPIYHLIEILKFPNGMKKLRHLTIGNHFTQNEMVRREQVFKYILLSQWIIFDVFCIYVIWIHIEEGNYIQMTKVIMAPFILNSILSGGIIIWHIDHWQMQI
jgi:hypothetical protein